MGESCLCGSRFAQLALSTSYPVPITAAAGSLNWHTTLRIQCQIETTETTKTTETSQSLS